MADYTVTLSEGTYDGEEIVLGEPWPRYGTFWVRVGVGPLEPYAMTSDTEPYTAAYSEGDTEPDEDFPEAEEGPQGPPGVDGPAGPEGPPGEDGRELTHQGDWDVDTTYSAMDIVTHENASYFSLLDLNTGHEPGDGDPHWGVLSEAGPEGPEGPEGPAGADGAPGTPGAAGPQGDPGSPLPERQDTTLTTASLANSAAESGTVTLAVGYRILRVETNRAARVRLYTTAAQRDADTARPDTDDPAGNHGVVVEVLTTLALLELDMSPVPQGYSLETTPTSSIPYRVENRDTTTGTVIVTFTWQQQEA